MKKYYLLIISFLLLFSGYSYALEYPSVNSNEVFIYDISDKKVLYEKNSSDKASIASLTKIATTITAIETISDLNEEVEITQSILNTVRWDASRAGLKVGDKVTYLDLLYASIIPSGADATNAIAISSSGTIEKFVEKMNSLVSSIGLSNTHFANVTGLDDVDHYSNALDIGKLLDYALKNELFKKIYTTKEYTLSNGLKVSSTLNTYNRYMNLDVSSILGSKTGFTQDAGLCMSSLIDIDDHNIILITLGASQIGNNYYNLLDTVDLVIFLNEHYKSRLIFEKGSFVKNIDVLTSVIDSYGIYTNSDIYLFLPDDYDSNLLSVTFEGVDNISYKNKIGDSLGIINYYYDNNLIKSEEVLLDKEIKISIGKFILENIIIIGILLTSTVVLVVMVIKKK